MKIVIPKIVLGGPQNVRAVVLIAALGWLTPKLLDLAWKSFFPEDAGHSTALRASTTAQLVALTPFRERWNALSDLPSGRWWHLSDAFNPSTTRRDAPR
jgi:hypothetical protein